MSVPSASPADPESLIELATTLAQGPLAERAARHDRDAVFPADNYADLHRAGLCALTVPRSHGGLGVSWPTYTAVMGELAQGCTATTLAFNMHHTIVRFVDWHGTEAQKAEVFGAVVEEGALLASITSEPRSTLRGGRPPISTKATRTDTGWSVSGAKHFCSLSTGARWFFTWCTDPDQRGIKALRTLLIPADSPGVQIHDDWDVMAMRASASNSVTFHDVAVPDANLVPGAEPLLRQGRLDTFIPGYGAIYTGLAEAAHRFTVDFARTTTFDPDPHPISHYPTVQRHIAEMATAVAASKGLVRAAADAAEANVGARRRAIAFHQSKLFAAETAQKVTRLALEVCGGRALSRRLPLERFLRDAQAAPVMGPATDTSRALIGQLTLGLDPS
ncbi:MAG: acyl-CoA dehydrogenase family protein [Acidimicrobiales bacterium]